METGKLFLCATPIGNLEDITYRAVRILKEVDLVAAEDTRQTRKLFNHYEIKTSITSYHKFNIKQKTPLLIEKLRQGLNIAVVSDAGLPGISDPGMELVSEAIKNGIHVVPIPGPSAVTTALVASGLNASEFSFHGFLPSKRNLRKKFLTMHVNTPNTLIFYESPHRLIQSLEDIQEIFGERMACVARELTKKFEEFTRGKPAELIEYYREKGVKGEITLIISGAEKQSAGEALDMSGLLRKVEGLIEDGLHKKEALKVIARKYNVSKRELYQEFEKQNRVTK
ncbi:16S rRNA (cytidine(1402)-2'-O)-methyltransferase [Desulfitibacter alkalitolerans]|uniref:16S rRNA (cytidine(1402)-2'-O)-methyltransferase n=1 Tax=Desulfitibacter alkalitolerans TaxID=264641 RepID=UPI000484E183|nr:16S rRNA (cytidine(1402)-2'-O)-methyltransferase [Desulfitibacter alkalitolerans]